ncbi:hypothetical protein SDC9_103932 [bioreactor metagenome]|jgi:hypothetical protein|uniref:Uncharacterized protein n=2 Tax=root TaxID=1 RepID=A0AAN0K756_9ACTN|nr:hypothetical protein [Brooklawnia sp. SH051]MCB0883250.1 hypothetical protein [Propionibacteriaceae bacterium]MEA5120299.1 hypothetical protein [Propionibacterium sp.]NLI85161.1 hypothetical protein [Propionibacterium sp.]BEH02641.1 hypothetical protein brsh051_19220 [Brooklawnia sp. SH051]
MSVSGAALTTPFGASGTAIHGLGGCVRVLSDGPDSKQRMATLRQLWARCLQPESCNQEAPVISLGAIPDDGPTFWERTTQQITAELIGQQAGKLLMLHAGGLCNPETGASVVYVAPSRTGKTTLTLSLSGRFGYLSDETIALDEQLHILG